MTRRACWDWLTISYQPVAFQDDESEIFLASHASDQVPFTWDSEYTASTGYH
jgi:hypothetical protein